MSYFALGSVGQILPMRLAWRSWDPPGAWPRMRRLPVAERMHRPNDPDRMRRAESAVLKSQAEVPRPIAVGLTDGHKALS
jgi:hypothetical protein